MQEPYSRRKAADRTSAPADSPGPRRILLVKTSSLGDVVHNLPVATALRRWFPQAAIDWVVEEGCADIARLHPALGRVIPVAVRRWRHALLAAATWSEMAAFRRALRREAYDLVLDSQGLLKSGLIASQARLSAQGERVGYAAEVAREALAARCYQRGIAIPRNMHAVLRNLGLAAAACHRAPAAEPDPVPDYGIAAPPLVAPWLAAAQPAYALLLTASSRADKSWPQADWLALARALVARGLALVLPAATDADRRRAGELARQIGAAAILAPPSSLGEIAGLCAGARLVVGVDTGLTHLAAALGRPTLCLFAGTDPALTGVLAGGTGAAAARARNLGASGAPPDAAAAIATALQLLQGDG